MDYPSAVKHLLTLVDMERMVFSPGTRVRYELGRMHRFLEALGNPHIGLPTVHITGTKGKGSTAAMVASILEAAGYRVGLYVSPHLHSFRERIQVGLEPLSEGAFASLVERLWPAAERVSEEPGVGRVTTFEMLTAMAFVAFREAGCRFQILEVGMGGTLDATNVVPQPLVCVLTSISLDHTHILGNTVEEIARDKAGIIKAGAIVVSGPQREEVRAVVEGVCREKGASLVRVAEEYRWTGTGHTLEGQAFELAGREGGRKVWTPLLGEHQMENAAVAVGTVEALGRQGVAIGQEAVVEGLKSVRWPGRLEVLSREPLVVIDGAHNPYSALRLREAVRDYLPHQGMALIFGCSRDKDLEGMARELAPLKPVVVATRSRHPRSVPPDVVAAAFAKHGLSCVTAPGVEQAVEEGMSMAKGGDLLLGAGSLFVAAEVREVVKGIRPERYEELETLSSPGTVETKAV
ncbi:MAG: bifunctional folylpolyglutamate synthase/dihydrofolate synthase [Chloroflexi bacterium]|nr:bifunctional folylpolyglutamate synthase/dihydrofolate synthase [Chloroflexota bacterium]